MITLSDVEAATIAPILAAHIRTQPRNGLPTGGDLRAAFSKIFRAYQHLGLTPVWSPQLCDLDRLMREIPNRAHEERVH